jgi:hypothetical protein
MNETGMSILRSEYAKQKISEIAEHRLVHECADIANSAMSHRRQFESAIEDDAFCKAASVDTEHVGANIVSAEYRQ